MALNTVNQTGARLLTGLTATGTNQATGYPLVSNGFHEFTTVASGKGATLPVPKLPAWVTVYNGGASTLSVYPPVGGTVDGGSANAAYSLSAGDAITFWAAGLSTWYVGTTAGSGGGGGVT